MNKEFARHLLGETIYSEAKVNDVNADAQYYIDKKKPVKWSDLQSDFDYIIPKADKDDHLLKLVDILKKNKIKVRGYK